MNYAMPFAAVLLTSALSAVLPLQASAHARLLKATPPENAQLSADQVPKEVVLEFSETLEPTFSKIQVKPASSDAGASGAPVQEVADGKGTLTGDKNDTLRVPLKLPLKAGNYVVIWKVTSIDTHKMSGRYKFTVK